MLVVFFCLLLVPPTYLSYRVLQQKKLPRELKGLCILLLYCISQMFTVNHFVFGSLSGPQMPRWLLACQAFALCCEIFFFLWLLFWRLCSKALQKKSFSRERRSICQGLIGTAIGAIGSVSLAYSGVQNGLAKPCIVHLPLVLDALPLSLQGCKLCFFSDVHIGPLTTREWVRFCVDAIAKEKPDIITLGGDLSDGSPLYTAPDGGSRGDVFNEFSRLQAPLGVWAVTGNHEYYSDYKAWMRLYREAGIRFLHNSTALFSYNGARFALVGRDDKQADRYFAREEVPLADIVANLPERSLCPRILLDHRPQRAFEGVSLVDVQLSGHTHGGQCLGMDRLVAYANSGFVRGFYTVESMPLFVSSGAGLWSGFPVRIGVPAEIVIFTLERSKR